MSTMGIPKLTQMYCPFDLLWDLKSIFSRKGGVPVELPKDSSHMSIEKQPHYAEKGLLENLLST